MCNPYYWLLLATTFMITAPTCLVDSLRGWTHLNASLQQKLCTLDGFGRQGGVLKVGDSPRGEGSSESFLMVVKGWWQEVAHIRAEDVRSTINNLW